MYKMPLIFLLLLSGCVANYQDMSGHPGYAHLISTSYTTKEDMYITGINLPPGYGKNINVYLITPTNNIAIGPEVITRVILNKGTDFTIRGIKNCTNCLEKEVIAIVSLGSYVKEVDVPVEISLNYIKPKYVSKI
ncbi:MAG: hypothetical protein ACYDBT_15670 [Desulfobulbaceae bacterium]